MRNQAHSYTLELNGAVEILQAQYSSHAFAPHWHHEHAIGLIDSGVEQFTYAGATHRAAAGQLVLLNAGETHDGEAFDERGFSFSMLYVPPSMLHDLVPERNAPRSTLHFKRPIVTDGVLSKQLRLFHQVVRQKHTKLEVECALSVALGHILSRTMGISLSPFSADVPNHLGRARDYLHSRLYEDVSLDDLVEVSGLSRFHLLRCFRLHFGLPPHAYQLQQRIFAVKKLLHSNQISQVALQCGFSDQSHLTRVFRSFVGTTPGGYAQQFRARRSPGRPPS